MHPSNLLQIAQNVGMSLPPATKGSVTNGELNLEKDFLVYAKWAECAYLPLAGYQVSIRVTQKTTIDDLKRRAMQSFGSTDHKYVVAFP